MTDPENLAGRTFGSLTYIQDVARKNRNRRALFSCVCGNTHESAVGPVKSGRTHNCGCKRAEMARLSGLKKRKGLPRGTSTFHAWTGMKQRCYNQKSRNFPRYGARGIIVCNRWLASYENFYEDMGANPGSGYSLDRINVDGPYAPENCRWATWREQQNNRGNNNIVEWLGEKKTLTEWARAVGLKPVTAKRRFYAGWPLERVFSPVK